MFKSLIYNNNIFFTFYIWNIYAIIKHNNEYRELFNINIIIYNNIYYNINDIINNKSIKNRIYINILIFNIIHFFNIIIILFNRNEFTNWY